MQINKKTLSWPPGRTEGITWARRLDELWVTSTAPNEDLAHELVSADIVLQLVSAKTGWSLPIRSQHSCPQPRRQPAPPFSPSTPLPVGEGAEEDSRCWGRCVELYLRREIWTRLKAESTESDFQHTEGRACSEELWPTGLPGFANPNPETPGKRLIKTVPTPSDTRGKTKEQ